jgi:small-conductance mechanosensitive channel
MDTELDNTGDAEFFEVLREEGWKAETSTVRKNTSLNNNQVNSRRRKFREKGWIRDKNNGTDEKGRPQPSTIIVEEKPSVKAALDKFDTRQTEFDSFNDMGDELRDQKERIDEHDMQINELIDIVENSSADEDEIQEVTEELERMKKQFNNTTNKLVKAFSRTMGELLGKDSDMIENMVKENLRDD